MRIPLIILIFYFLPFIVTAQDYQAEKYELNLLQSKTGVMIIYNGVNHSFSLDIVAKDFNTGETPNYYAIDGQVLQVQDFPFQTKINFNSMTESDQKKNLTSYKDYEMKYLNELMKTDIKENYEFITLNNKIFIYWTYNMPETYDVKAQCYLVTICFDQILLLNSPVTPSDEVKGIKDILEKYGKTLCLYDHPLNLGKLYDSLDKEITIKFIEKSYGIYQSLPKGTEEMANSPSGTHGVVFTTNLIKKSDTVPLKLGNEFGIEYELESKYNKIIGLDIEWIFPKKIYNAEKNSELDKLKYPIELPTNFVNSSTYKFEKDAELVDGVWQLNIYRNNELLHTKKFILSKK